MGRLTQILSLSTMEVYPPPFTCKTSEAQKVNLTTPSHLLIVDHVLKLKCLTSFITVCRLPSPNPTTYQIQVNLDISLSPRNSPGLIARDCRKANLGALGGASHPCAPWSWHTLPLLGEAGGGTFCSKPGICHLRAKDELIELR